MTPEWYKSSFGRQASYVDPCRIVSYNKTEVYPAHLGQDNCSKNVYIRFTSFGAVYK